MTIGAETAKPTGIPVGLFTFAVGAWLNTSKSVEVQYIGNSKGRKENPTVVR